jgi:type III secretory pathway component EscR
MTWEIVVEKREENLHRETNKEERKCLQEAVVSAKELLEKNRNEERNHFLSGSHTNKDIVSDHYRRK